MSWDVPLYPVVEEDRPGLGVNLDEDFMAANLVETITE